MFSKRVAAATETELQFQAGDTVVKEGEHGEEMYVIRSGRLHVSKLVDDDEVVLHRLGPGDFFGEMSVLESMPREATVVCETEVRLLVLQPGALLVRLRRDPTFAYELIAALSRRVRNANHELEQALSKSKDR